jgi:hypothetical protein
MCKMLSQIRLTYQNPTALTLGERGMDNTSVCVMNYTLSRTRATPFGSVTVLIYKMIKDALSQVNRYADSQSLIHRIQLVIVQALSTLIGLLKLRSAYLRTTY